MSNRRTARRMLVMLLLVAGVLFAVSPASADHGRYRGGYHRGPRVAVFVGVPPIAVHIGPRAVGYYQPYYSDGRYDDRYDERDAYDAGYDDGYRDRAREEWRRRAYYRHRDCD